MLRSKAVLAAVAAVAATAAMSAYAQVPPWMAAELRGMGRIVEAQKTGQLYAPLQRKPPYDGVKVVRDVHYGPGDKETLDVFTPAHPTEGKAVVVFVHGGAFVGGDKATNAHGEASPFYDNIMLWSVAKDMVGVNLNYPLAPRAAYPTVQKDIGAGLAWVRRNIRRYGGDPNRVFIWGHSAGASHVAAYVSHPEFHPGGQVGVRGAILSSGTYDLKPAPNGKPHVYFGEPSTYAERSAQPGLLKTKVALYISAAELDPPQMVAAATQLNDALCAAGHCPAHFEVLKDHSHISESYHVNTADESLTRPLLAFIRSH